MTDPSPDQPSNEEGEPTASASEGGELEEAARQDTTEEATGSAAPEALEPPEPPTAPAAPTSPQHPAAASERGQRRITRHTTTSTTRTETTTDETIVETVAVAPPVWAAPAGEHPRPVG